MKERTASVQWNGNLEQGEGRITFGEGRFDEPYSASSRFGDDNQTNPEELLGAAHAACFSMALSGALVKAGKEPSHIHTDATVRIEKQGDGFSIPIIKLKTEAAVPDISVEAFNEIAENAKNDCPVSKALATCEIKLEATLL